MNAWIRRAIAGVAGAGPLLVAGPAAAFDVELIHPSAYSTDTAAMDSALGITGLVIEDFEDLDLVPGLRVATTNPDSAPNSVLPNLYRDGSGAFNNNSWDGPGALVNTVNNWNWFCSDPECALTNIAQRRTFLLPGASKFGIGLGNFQAEIVDHAVLVNGVEVVGAIESLPGFVNGINVRNGYLVIKAGPGEVINEVSIELRQNGTKTTVAGASGDGLIFDRMAFAPVAGLASFTLKRSLIAGCKSVSGTVTLAEPAPPGGTIVTIDDTLDAATPPATVLVRAGQTSRSFTVRTAAVDEPQSGVVTAVFGGKTLSQPLTLRPMGLQAVTLAQKSVVGGAEVAGTAKLECAAGPGPIEVSLSSSLPEVAAVAPAMLTIPAGEATAAFTVTTVPVLATSKPKIVGTANGITKSRTLTVTTPVLVTPTSLKFGLVPIGTTSPALSTTLSNRGDAPFAVSSIALSGSNAKYYAQANDCPAELAPGAACTIEVRFTPADTRSRSAKLVIGTDVANPVGVALSGTGVTPP
jgi:ribosomal protein L27